MMDGLYQRRGKLKKPEINVDRNEICGRQIAPTKIVEPRTYVVLFDWSLYPASYIKVARNMLLMDIVPAVEINR